MSYECPLANVSVNLRQTTISGTTLRRYDQCVGSLRRGQGSMVNYRPYPGTEESHSDVITNAALSPQLFH